MRVQFCKSATIDTISVLPFSASSRTRPRPYKITTWKMTTGDISQIPDVEIDESGVFKYILAKVTANLFPSFLTMNSRVCYTFFFFFSSAFPGPGRLREQESGSAGNCSCRVSR